MPLNSLGGAMVGTAKPDCGGGAVGTAKPDVDDVGLVWESELGFLRGGGGATPLEM